MTNTLVNENLRQSASTAELWKLEANEYVASIRSAIIGHVTCGITATFPTRIGAENFIESFGFSSWTFKSLTD